MQTPSDADAPLAAGGDAAGPRRFAVEARALPPAWPPPPGRQRPVSGPANAFPAPGKRFLIVDDGRGVALELAVLLEQRGSEALVTKAPSAVELVLADAFVHLGALRPGGGPLLPAAFGQFRDALAARVHTMLVATVGGGAFGSGSAARADWGGGICEPVDLGLRGLIAAIAAEHPGVLARAVDVDPKDSSPEIAARLFAELCDQAGPAVVGYLAGQRAGLRLAEVPALAAPVDAPVDQDSVVLITGGAHGVTATVALELARATGCHVELLGRTPAPGPEDPELDTGDPVELRRRLASMSFGDQQETEAETARLLRVRQLRATLAALRETAASVHYHAVDVRDAAAVSAVLGEVYLRAGRVDGVLHGAGAQAGRMIRGKTPESFAHAYTTRVDGARALAAGLRGSFRFFVLLGGAPGTAGAPGYRGPADYAAANDAFDALARQWPGRAPGRVVAVDWDAGLEPEQGLALLLAEIAEAAGPGQVAYLPGGATG